MVICFHSAYNVPIQCTGLQDKLDSEFSYKTGVTNKVAIRSI